MLKQRIITALILAPLFLLIVIYGQKLWFAGMVLLIGGVAIFEWLKINQLPVGLAVFNAIILVVLCAYLMRWLPLSEFYFLLLSLLSWLPAFLWLRCHQWGYQQTSLQIMVKTLFGVLAILLFMLSMQQLHHHEMGVFRVLSLVFLIWVADIGAYFSGKNFGRHKLAVNISPGKTWEGVIGAQIAVIIYAVVLALMFNLNMLRLIPIIMLVALLSVVGDLTASLGKRQAKVKDSSKILPGHGGVLDRFDSMIIAAPVYLILLSVL
ncbi:MAG: phosphatidate cytidylyltransferase [Proteobacteria bacterium]|nr:MAG: phosphatidate cytidylyltransferase [Pseudomonadota bacterium]